MTDRSILTRRGVLAAGAAMTVRSARAGDKPADADKRQHITLGHNSFSVPSAYLFGEMMPVGLKAQELPPYFSFAFTMPDGAPAGADIEFPPISRPFVLERDKGRFLVMCYRVSASGPGALNTPPIKALANMLIDTKGGTYSNIDDSLSFRNGPKAEVEERYVSFLEKNHDSLVQAFLEHIDDAEFFYGEVEFNKPGVTTVAYIPTERHAEIRKSLEMASNLLMSWKDGR